MLIDIDKDGYLSLEELGKLIMKLIKSNIFLHNTSYVYKEKITK